MDVVTLGAALSIIKKMPDTAASSAAVAEEAADRAEAAARTLTVDDTLSVKGQAADSKAVGDRFSNIESNIGKLTYSTISNGIYVTITLATTGLAGDIVAVCPVTDNNVVSVNLRATNSNNAEIALTDLTPGEWTVYRLNAEYTNIKVVYTLDSIIVGTTYKVLATISGDETFINAFSYLMGKTLKNSNDISEVEGEVDSPFSVPVSNSIKGIIAFEFLDNDAGFKTNEIQQYRLRGLYYKTSGYYLYCSLQKYVNDAWATFDSIAITTANAPTESELMILEGTYHRFRIAYVPSLMTAVGLGQNLEYYIKNTARQPFVTYLQNQVDAVRTQLQYGDYENQDTIKHVIVVDPNGNGDYTTIASAYASITDSSFVNQYEVILEDGVYEEYNLICPPYTHTHGRNPKGVTVTSENVTGSTLPVFDQKSFPSKLSNMTIISGTGYCIHNDYNFINTGAVYNENLYCKKVYDTAVQNFAWRTKSNTAIIGAGAQYAGVKVIYNNCTFEDGTVVCHSNSYSVEQGNFHLVLKNCKVVNAWVQLNMAGNTGAAEKGNWVCEITDLYAPKGCPALNLKFGARKNNSPWFGWQVIGGNNHNFAIMWDNSSDPLAVDKWENVNTIEKVFVQATTAVTKGQWITDSLAVCGADENPNNVMGIALENASAGDTFAVWVGSAYSYTGANGEYGIGSDGTLSATAATKIGKVLNNIFYRYYKE